MSFKRITSRMGDRGAAITEAALVVPILLLLTFGIWSVSRAWSVNNSLEHAAREAARYGATIDPWDASTSPTAVIAVSDASLNAASIPIGAVADCVELVADSASPTCDTHVNATGTDQVFVKMTYPNYTLQFLFFSMDIDIEAVAVSRFEAS